MLICRSPQIDVIVDVTGSVEFGANVFIEAFDHGKHVVMMNAEVDATIGPILQTYAKRAGVTLVGLRRRRARPADEPRPVGRRSRLDPPRRRATSRAFRTPTATRRRSRRGPSDGSRTLPW